AAFRADLSLSQERQRLGHRRVALRVAAGGIADVERHGDVRLDPFALDLLAIHLDAGDGQLEKRVVREEIAAAAEKSASRAGADERDAPRLEVIGKDFEATPGALVNNRDQRLVPAHVGEMAVAFAVRETEGLRAAKEGLGRVRRRTAPATAEVDHQRVGA